MYASYSFFYVQGVTSSKNDGFTLASGDFPTLGSEKDNSGKNMESQGCLLIYPFLEFGFLHMNMILGKFSGRVLTSCFMVLFFIV